MDEAQSADTTNQDGPAATNAPDVTDKGNEDAETTGEEQAPNGDSSKASNGQDTDSGRLSSDQPASGPDQRSTESTESAENQSDRQDTSISNQPELRPSPAAEKQISTPPEHQPDNVPAAESTPSIEGTADSALTVDETAESHDAPDSGDSISELDASDGVAAPATVEGENNKSKMTVGEFLDKQYRPLDNEFEQALDDLYRHRKQERPDSADDSAEPIEPPTGEELPKLENTEASRAERASKQFFEEAGDFQDATETASNSIHDLWAQHRPEGHAETSTGPEYLPAQHEGLHGGDAATGIVVTGIVVAKLGQWIHEKLRTK